MRPNTNTSALRYSLLSTIEPLRLEARRIVAEALASHETAEDAAKPLGMNGQALRRLRDIIAEQDAGAPKKPKTKPAPKKATKKTTRKARDII